MNGIVKWFDKRKGYGFIESDTDSDIFVHYTNFTEDLSTLDEGQEVSFEIVEGEKGPRAEKVSLKDNQTA